MLYLQFSFQRSLQEFIFTIGLVEYYVIRNIMSYVLIVIHLVSYDKYIKQYDCFFCLRRHTIFCVS